MDEAITSIARELGIDLTPRGMDDLDFHQVHVASIRRALEAAYRAGREEGAERACRAPAAGDGIEAA